MDMESMLRARALVLADLSARGAATADAVSLLEDAVSSRTWWLEHWPQGAMYVAGLVAQDVQDGIMDTTRHWPLCLDCDGPEHALYIQPDLGGPEPTWVCESSGHVVAPLGHLGADERG
jgi:hypothetical protein